MAKESGVPKRATYLRPPRFLLEYLPPLYPFLPLYRFLVPPIGGAIVSDGMGILLFTAGRHVPAARAASRAALCAAAAAHCSAVIVFLVGDVTGILPFLVVPFLVKVGECIASDESAGGL